MALGATTLAVALTPPEGITAASGLLGLPRLVLYAIAGAVLGWSSRGAAFSRDAGGEAADCAVVGEHPQVYPHDRALFHFASLVSPIGIGLLLASAIAVWNATRLLHRLDDPLGPIVWAASMLVVLGATLLPSGKRLEWPARWPEPGPLERGFDAWLGRWRWAGLGVLLGVAALLRFPRLGEIPIGIQADEGDRANWALQILYGQNGGSWFDSGWYYINLVYFHVLAASMSVFGTSVAGTRTLSAIVGLGFVAVVAWIGVRHFGWRVGLLATALATAGALYVQESRYIGESGPTILLWSLSVAGFYEGGRAGKPWAWAVAGLAGGLSLYFYPSARLWAVGAGLSVALLWYFESGDGRWRVVRGAGIAAIASLIAVAPFLVHLHSQPQELAQRYDETSVLAPQNQERLDYLHPPVSTPELLALQFERTLGMFDRYQDGIAQLPIHRPAMPFPLGALTLLGLAYAVFRARRDPRFGLLVVWFAIGMSGVLLTVETPDYLRAIGAMTTLPLLGALVLVELADRLPDVVTLTCQSSERRNSAAIPLQSSVGHLNSSTSLLRSARAIGIGLALIAGATVVGESYLYLVVYPPIMAPKWEYATQEGLQVARLGQNGPVYALEMYQHHVQAGWVRFLAQDARTGRVGNPGASLPILPGSATNGGAAPLPADGQGLGFLLYRDPNQTPYLGLLQALYPGGVLQPPVDDREAYIVSPAALARTRGVTVLSGSSVLGVVPRFGDLPADASAVPLTWQAGLRLPATGAYALRLEGGPARLSLDGQLLGQSDGPTLVVGFSAAGGLHFVQVTATPSGSARAGGMSLALGQGGTFRALGPDDTYAPMDAPWGLLARVGPEGSAGDLAGAAPDSLHLDTTVAGAALDEYLSINNGAPVVIWSGRLLAPRSGAYRMAFTADGPVRVTIDGKPVAVPVTGWDEWKIAQPGALVPLNAGPHAVVIALPNAANTSPVLRWNWVPPREDGAADVSADWTVVPPTVLRPAPDVWNVQVKSD